MFATPQRSLLSSRSAKVPGASFGTGGAPCGTTPCAALGSPGLTCGVALRSPPSAGSAARATLPAFGLVVLGVSPLRDNLVLRAAAEMRQPLREMKSATSFHEYP